MRARRLVALVAALFLLLTLSPAVLAQPGLSGAADVDDSAAPRTTESRAAAADAIEELEQFEDFEQLATALAVADDERTRLPGKPRNDVLVDVPVNPNDESIPLNLIPYHEFAPRLRALQASPRISVEIIGQTVLGRDMHLVVATSPMTDAQWDEWQRLSDLRIDDPLAAVAAFNAGEYATWKQPLFINNNIHGNEWEGTDGTFQTLERLAFADDADTLRLLDEHVMAFIVSNNPDGRVAGTRANANGFDMNRDYITASQPEPRAVRAQMIRYSAMTMLDLHGYVSCTLIEPTTGPHGIDYEYDLYIRNAIRNALAMEQAVIALNETRANVTCAAAGGGRRIDIPWRNRTSGWDDWPPIFTPMYAMYHGSIGHTVEIPLNPRGLTNVPDRHDRTRINTAVAKATIEANFLWANANKQTLLADQLELYRRGAMGEASRPIDDPLALSLAAGNNGQTLEQTYPRAYVIPAGAGQRSETAATRVAQFLIDNDVAVHRATGPVTVGGTTYPAGSYVVDMHQAKRGLANMALDTGRDVSLLFPTMYDISAWSHGRLWGATVVRVANGSLSGDGLERVAAASPTGSITPGRPFYALTVDSPAGVRAVNALLRDGVSLTRLPDGRFVVAGADYAAAAAVSAAYGVTFADLPRNQNRGGRPFSTLRIGTSASFDEVFALQGMSYDVTAVSHTGFNNGTYAFTDFDAFYVSTTTFNPLSLNAAQQAAFADWLLDGGAVVLRGANGFTFNTRANLLPGITQQPGAGDANGIAAVVNSLTSPITATAIDTAFVSSPRTYTLTAGTRVDVAQRFADGSFFLAGHWRGSGTTTQAAAAGRPVVVSGKARGASVALFGTEPLYRSHPEGMFTQVAEALWQSGICAPDFTMLEAELNALVAAGGITSGLEAKIRNAFAQNELWLTLDQQRPIAHTHLERAISLLLWQADVVERGKPNQGDPVGLRALAATIDAMLQNCLPS